MVGHYVNVLSADAEDAILTGILKPGAYGDEHERCLVGWAADVMTTEDGEAGPRGRQQHYGNTHWRTMCIRGVGLKELLQLPHAEAVEDRFDALCERFTTKRVARVIRQRILTNRLWREMSQGGVSPAAAPESLTV